MVGLDWCIITIPGICCPVITIPDICCPTVCGLAKSPLYCEVVCIFVEEMTLTEEWLPAVTSRCDLPATDCNLFSDEVLCEPNGRM